MDSLLLFIRDTCVILISNRAHGFCLNIFFRGMIFGLLFWGAAAEAWAQGELTRQPRRVQVVLVIDDSQSMSVERFGNNDPDRLAVFAARALLGVLDDGDWATVVRMNGDDPPDLAPLAADHRNLLLEELSLDGSLASYQGRNTPCRSALKQVEDLLDRSRRPAMPQVVIFLSDGVCQPRPEDRLADIFEGLKPADAPRHPGPHLYYLRFSGTEGSPGLTKLAERSGGEAKPVRRGSPTLILHAFAQALSRSQGYESHFITPQTAQIPGHSGARRVRVLVVAEGEGEELGARIRSREGDPAIERLDAGEHRYPGGRAYRFLSAQYRPVGTPVELEVTGAGASWQAVVLPEYHLTVDLRLKRGSCDKNGSLLTSNTLAAGTDLCGEIRLLNALGEPVGVDVTSGRLQGELMHQPPGGQAQSLPANGLAADRAIFQMDVSALESGPHQVRAAIRATTTDREDEDRRIWSDSARTLEVVDRGLDVEPRELTFRKIFPGGDDREYLAVVGRYSEAEVTLSLADSTPLPPCVSLSFAGRPLGTPVLVKHGKQYEVEALGREGCGSDKVETGRVDLKLRFPEEMDDQGISIPVHWSFDGAIDELAKKELRVKAGTTTAFPFEIKGRTGSFEVSVGSIRGEHAENRLEVGFLPRKESAADPSGNEESSKAGRLLASEWVELGPDGSSLSVVVDPAGCCRTGTYRTHLALRPQQSGRPISLPIAVVVEGSWWACWGLWVKRLAVGVFLFLLIFYLFSMATHTRLLNADQLAARLIPLRASGYGGAPRPSADREVDREEVEDFVKAGLSFRERAASWFNANPLVFALPGRRYVETAELYLTRETSTSSLALAGERDPVQRLKTSSEDAAEQEGRLLVCAGRPMGFYLVPGRSGRVAPGLILQNRQVDASGPRVVPLTPGQRLEQPHGDRRKDGIVGWQLD